MRWSCGTCPGKCNRTNRLQSILVGCNLNITSERQRELNYSVISTLKIPPSLDKIMAQVYFEQQSNGIILPSEIFPEKECCEHAYQFDIKENTTLEKNGIIIYTTRDIVKLPDHKGEEILN